MKFPFPLVEAKLLKREKRFLAYARLENGKEIIAHCPNPGSMKGNAETGSRVWFMDFGENHQKSGKKLRYKWIFVESSGVKVCVDTSLANTLVDEALREKKISELSFYDDIKREVTVADSRFDFSLHTGDKKIPELFLEVKSVSMGDGLKGMFPDSVTKRGQKHVLGLGELAAKKKRAVLFFLHMREKGECVTTAKHIDPEYDRVLREAMKKGMEVLVYGIEIRKNEIFLGERGILEL